MDPGGQEAAGPGEAGGGRGARAPSAARALPAGRQAGSSPGGPDRRSEIPERMKNISLRLYYISEGLIHIGPTAESSVGISLYVICA